MKHQTLLHLFLIAAAAMMAACAGPGTVVKAPAAALVKLAPADYPDFLDGYDPSTLTAAIDNSLRYYSKLPREKDILFGQEKFTAAELSQSLSALREFLNSGPSSALVDEYVRGHFDAYVPAGHEGGRAVLFTGYYTPELPARALRDDVFRFPLYGLPDDIVTADLGQFRERFAGEKIIGTVRGNRFVPYYTRKELERGALAGRGLELAWCSDPVDVFFLMVQGSGVLVLEDGTRVYVNYAGANGWPYRSIGKLLIGQGKADVSEMSLPWLKGYLHSHPGEAEDILNYNESYVFFSMDDTGPYGSMGEPVTGGRTVAVDEKVFPSGALAYIATEVPVFSDMGELKGWEPYRGFVLDQDAGGAIKGPGRADIYFGFGVEAELRAGYMRREGKFYIMAPRRVP